MITKVSLAAPMRTAGQKAFQPGNSQNQTVVSSIANSEPKELELIDQKFITMADGGIEGISKESGGICRKKFIKECGAEDFPMIKNYSSCLQKRFAQFQNDPQCAKIAHYIIYIRFLTTLNNTLPQCKFFVDACQAKFNKSPDIIKCVYEQKTIHHVCIKTIRELIYHRKIISTFLGVDFNKE